MKDGDIYRWEWKDVEAHGGYGDFRAYHCKSQIAVCKDGVLYDTFWGISWEHTVSVKDVNLTFLGNSNEMSEIREYEMPYYRRQDIVDTRHSNNRRAPIYLKAGAERDAETMLAHATYKRETAERERDSADRDINHWTEIESAIQSGNLTVHF